jgi:hypothetical protein
VEFSGTNGVDIQHFTELWQKYPKMQIAPYAGAYCARVQMLAAGTDAGYLHDAVKGVMTVNDTAHIRFRCFIGTDIANAGTSTVACTLLELRAAGATEVNLGIRITADGDVSFAHGELTAATTFGPAVVTPGKWYTIESHLELAAGTSTDDGSITSYVTPEGGYSGKDISPAITTIDQDAITNMRFGLPVQAANASGTLFLDDLIFDVNVDPPFSANANRHHVFPDRYKTPVILNQSGFAFVGPGKVTGVTLVGDGLSEETATGDDFLRIYDTNFMRTDGTRLLVDESAQRLALRTTAGGEVLESVQPCFNVSRGCFVHLGTETANDQQPRAIIHYEHATGYGSPGAVRNLASQLGAQSRFFGATADV